MVILSSQTTGCAMIDVSSLAALSQTNPSEPSDNPAQTLRLMSIWEITTWILPMAPEHLRRVLAADPTLPQGSAGAEGGTRWFTPNEVTALRTHFAAGPRKGRYLPGRPAGTQAPLIALAQPRGKAGRTTAAVHLATAAALAGYRVLLLDGDPAGELARTLGAQLLPEAAGVLSFIARSAGQHQRRLNEGRLNRGEDPLPMPEALSAALDRPTAEAIQPTRWPGLDLLAAPESLMQADMRIAAWRSQQRSWRPWPSLAEALTAEGLRQRYDLILCDTGPGLGPLALTILASADVLLVPLPLSDSMAETKFGSGLRSLATAMATLQAEDQSIARALGLSAAAMGWRRVLALPTRAGADTAQRLAGFAAKLGPVLLPSPLPEIAPIAKGDVANFYDLDYRDIGRLAYAAQRQACETAWRGLARVIAELWAEEASAQNLLPRL
jgi:chromosome partitioning protein